MVFYIYSSIDAVYSLYYSNTLIIKQYKKQQQQKTFTLTLKQHNEVQNYR